jgi:hypothetical protein
MIEWKHLDLMRSSPVFDTSKVAIPENMTGFSYDNFGLADALATLFYKQADGKFFMRYSFLNESYDRDTVISILRGINPEFKLLFSTRYGRSAQEFVDLGNGLSFYMGGFTHIEKPENYIWTERDEPYDGDMLIGNMALYYASEHHPKIVDIVDQFRAARVNGSKKVSRVYMLTESGGRYEMKSYDIDTPKMEDLDMHYGDGFEDFHGQLVERLTKKHKGVVLLHGRPGTGKTYYIRHLISEIQKADKLCIYIPSNIMDALMNPSTMSFIFDWIRSNGNNAVILLEDAEALIKEREGGRTGTIANLLNISDGILNDITKVQIIATFNMQYHEVDSAMKRSQRLIAEKEFGNLTYDQARSLIAKLNLKIEPRDNMVLADIYAAAEENDILRHEVKDKKKLMGFA